MAIKFKCDCGKALSAREIYAGRRVRCPECGKKVTVPEPEEAERADAEGKKRGVHRSRGRLEAELLAGEGERILFCAKPGMGVLIQRLIALNLCSVVFLIAPLIVLPSLLDKIGRYLMGGVVAHMALVMAGLVVAIVLNTLIWLTWQRTVYALTPTCILAQRGLFFITVQRMPIGKLRFIQQLRFGRGLAFYGG